MKRCALLLAALLALCAPMLAFAQAQGPDTPLVFRSTAEEARFHALTSSLRCVMCQNESLADSQAMIARDLRRQILALMRDGQSDAQIRQFLVARYGEFVLYKPRMEPATWVLWFGPPLLLAGGAIGLIVIVRRRSARIRRQLDDLGTTTPGTTVPDESSEDW
ncbi:MAG: cytochrome c-type biogenesis protein CcmH [Proteobacteria bacterium]|nr:cytochrome c-type biogenesis protein CcmH [Pseudomonadota bacterium]